MLELHLRACGAIILLLALVYPIYPRKLRWREQLADVSFLIRDIFVVHVGFILLLLVLQGVLLAFFPGTVTEDAASARALLGGLVAFWLYRLIAQLFIFDRRNWRGDRTRTLLHVVFTVLWIYLTAIPAWALWEQLSG